MKKSNLSFSIFLTSFQHKIIIDTEIIICNFITWFVYLFVSYLKYHVANLV